MAADAHDDSHDAPTKMHSLCVCSARRSFRLLRSSCIARIQYSEGGTSIIGRSNSGITIQIGDSDSLKVNGMIPLFSERTIWLNDKGIAIWSKWRGAALFLETLDRRHRFSINKINDQTNKGSSYSMSEGDNAPSTRICLTEGWFTRPVLKAEYDVQTPKWAIASLTAILWVEANANWSAG